MITHGIPKRFTLILITLLLAACSSFKHIGFVSDETANILAGKWDWSTSEAVCEGDNLLTISFSYRKTIMYVNHPPGFDPLNPDLEQTVEYAVIGEGEDIVTFQEIGEMRRYPNGEKYEWNLMLQGTEAFCWKAAPPGRSRCSVPIVKCD